MLIFCRRCKTPLHHIQPPKSFQPPFTKHAHSPLQAPTRLQSPPDAPQKDPTPPHHSRKRPYPQRWFPRCCTRPTRTSPRGPSSWRTTWGRRSYMRPLGGSRGALSLFSLFSLYLSLSLFSCFFSCLFFSSLFLFVSLCFSCSLSLSLLSYTHSNTHAHTHTHTHTQCS